MKLLILGSEGQLGTCLSDELKCTEHNTFYASRAEIDVSNFLSVNQMIRKIAPDVVVNTVAYTSVDKAEYEPEKTDLVNHLAVANIAEICADIEALLVHISTDYIFDGLANEPYKEEAKPNPLSIYGNTKLLSEVAIKQSGCRYLIIRTSWVFSEYGNNFMKTMLRLGAEQDEFKIVGDQIGCPTYAQDIAKTIVFIISNLDTNKMVSEIYHYCGNQSCSWFEFAEAIFLGAANYGFRTPVTLIPIKTSEYPTMAPRPMYSVLDCSKIFHDFGILPSDWRKGIKEVLDKMKVIK